MKLAAEGLPSSVPQGYDLLEKIPMGTSRSVEFMKMKQTQEIELARSINEISYILGARVHLAIPEKSVFVRESSPPTASVFVKLADGRALSREQIRSIVHIVSSSVPNMSSDNVTVVDQYGGLLSKPEDDPNVALTEKQLAHRIKIESLYRERILSLVSPIVGAGNLTAQVNVEMDYTNTQTTEETFDPESISTRSEQNSQDESTDRPARGIPGAVANQAPLAADLQVAAPETGEPAEFIGNPSEIMVSNGNENVGETDAILTNTSKDADDGSMRGKKRKFTSPRISEDDSSLGETGTTTEEMENVQPSKKQKLAAARARAKGVATDSTGGRSSGAVAARATIETTTTTVGGTKIETTKDSKT